MANELRSSGHSVGETNLHLQFTPAYRRDVFVEPLVRELTVGYLVQRAHELKVEVGAVECGPDHVHLFVANWKNWSIPVLVGQLKTYASRMLRKYHKELFVDKLWGNKFWSAGYFYRTVGAVNSETVKRYIAEGQQKHWIEQEQQNQTTLFSYAG